MKELKISKACFINNGADIEVKYKIMAHITGKQKISPVKRYTHRYKTIIIPVMSSVFLLGWYLIYQGTTNTVDKEIVLTQSTINDLVAMIDSETF